MESARVWIVTGASRGLGFALAKEVARRQETLGDLREKCGRAGSRGG